MRRIMIATPAHTGTVCVEYAHSLYYTGHLCATNGIEVYPVWLPRESLLQRARNDLVRMALEGKVDDMVFIDADQEWDPKHFIRLLGHPVDVVGAPVRKKNDRSEEYNISVAGSNIPVDLKTGLLIVDSVGTGFLRLSRKALQALWDTSDPYLDAGHDHRMIFEPRVTDGRFWSEDTVMCAKLRLAGINVHLDPTFTIAHLGTKKYTGDFEAWLASLKKSSAA